MRRLVSNKKGNASYDPKWQIIESSSDSDDVHSPVPAQISGNEDEDCGDDHQILKAGKRVEIDHCKLRRLSARKRVEVVKRDGELMYVAALRGDWLAAEVLLERDPNLGFDYVTEEGDRALHIAAAMKHRNFVEKLVERMSEKELALMDGRGQTACCYAAISGEVEIARLIIRNHPNLVTVRDGENATPLSKAALRGNDGMLSFLLKSTKVEDLSKQEWFDLLLLTIRGQLYGVAMDILGKDGSIAMMADEGGTALHLLARQEMLVEKRNSIMLPTYILFLITSHLDHKYKRSLFVRLGEKLWGEMQTMDRDNLLELIKKPVHILHEAAKAGHVELITMLTRTWPILIWETDCNGYTMFHLAVMYRQSDVFKLIYQVEAMIGFRAIWQDREGNNILHLAAKPAAVTRRKSPPAVRIQRELLWFQAVEQIMPPSRVMMKNKKGETPKDLFSKTHKKLLKESEVWMKNMADSYMLIATILLTIVFAAAFTIPGGYVSQTGEPVLTNKNWFKVFLIFEALGFIFSVVSIMMFQSIMASGFAQDDFLSKLPMLQRAGIHALLMSLLGAMTAFMSSISLLNSEINGLLWFAFCGLYCTCSLWVILECATVYRDYTLKNSIRSCSIKYALFNQNLS